MELLKEPKNAIATANLVGLIGTTVYFYKQLELMRTDMMRITQTLTGVLTRLSACEKSDAGKAEALTCLADQMKQLGKNLEDMPTIDFVEDLDQDLGEVVNTLIDNGIEVERPSQTPKAPPPARRSRAARTQEIEPEPRRPVRGKESRRTETRPAVVDDTDLIGEVRKQIR